MSTLNKTIKNFTPEEYRKLSVAQINEMMDKNIPFKVSKLYKLNHDLSFCPGTEILYRHDKALQLTRLERKFLALLVSRPGEIVDIETIKNIVWEKREVSVFTIRNIVNKIRTKTYYEIIKNISNQGYSIWQK